jgi:hypothetical protein
MSLSKRISARRKAVSKYSTKFRQFFGANLGNYLHLINGFEVIKFDSQIIQPPDGVSTKDVVAERFGSDAVELVLELIRL